MLSYQSPQPYILNESDRSFLSLLLWESYLIIEDTSPLDLFKFYNQPIILSKNMIMDYNVDNNKKQI